MQNDTLTRPGQTRRLPLWTLLFFVPLIGLVVALFAITAEHNAQLSAQAETHNAQLKDMTAVHNLQLKTMTEEHIAQLRAQAAEFQKPR